MGILNAKSETQRRPLYRDLLKVTHKTIERADAIAVALDAVPVDDMTKMLQAATIAYELRHFVKLARRVMDQTERRVLGGEQVPAGEKLVSIFEPH